MLRIVIILLLSVILVIGTIFIYKIYYTYQINKKIQSGEITGRKYMDVSKMVMIVVITGLILYAGILMYIIHGYETMDTGISRNNFAVIDTSDEDNYEYVSYFGNRQTDDASYAKVYSKDENVGYEKEIVESGDYRFIVFTRNAEADDFHPDFLCFVEYTGTDMEEYACYIKERFQSLEDEMDEFYVGSAGDISNDLLYIGNLDEGYRFDITMSLLNDEAERKYDEANQQDLPDAEEFASSVGKVSIIME